MYYLDSNNDLCEAQSHEIFRYFGRDSEMQGAYVTDTMYDCPEAAKSALALSDVDWENTNSAEKMAVGEIYTTPDNEIVSMEDVCATGNYLEFSDVLPSSDYPGGGMEYKLDGPFEDFVNVVDVKKYDENLGWYSINDNYMDKDMNGIDEMISDELYYAQKMDAEEEFYDIIGEDGQSMEDDGFVDIVSCDEQGIDDLLSDELYYTQKADVVEEDFSDNIGEDYDGRDERSI